MPRLTPSDLLTATEHEPAWLVRDFLPRDHMMVLIGKEGVGKSSLLYYLSLCVATGTPFLDLPTTQAKVLYFDSENSRPDCQGYLRALWLGLGQPDTTELDRCLRIEHFSLGDNWIPAFRASQEWAPDFILFDTANSCFSIRDENSNAEAAAILNAVRKYRAPGSTVVFMKHQRESHEEKPDSARGAKYWLGAVDQVAFLKRDVGHPITGPHGDTYHRTKLVKEKTRVYGLRRTIRVIPVPGNSPLGNSLIFKASPGG